MIGKIKNLAGGSHLLRLQRYLSGPAGKRIAGFETRNLAVDNLLDATLLMEAQGGLSVRAKKPFSHLTVSYAPEDRVSREQMMADADRVLVALGASEAQAVIIVHSDKPYQHFHIAFNRVTADGHCISDSNSKRKIETVLRRIEQENGLRQVAGRHAVSTGDLATVRFKGGRAARRGYTTPPSDVVEIMQSAKTRQELDRRLAAIGWRLEATKAKLGQKAGGLTLKGPAGAKARASDCGRKCSGPALARRFAAPVLTSTPPLPSPTTLPSQPVTSPRRTNMDALARALKKARARPRLQRITRTPSATGTIRRVLRVPNPTIKL